MARPLVPELTRDDVPRTASAAVEAIRRMGVSTESEGVARALQLLLNARFAADAYGVNVTVGLPPEWPITLTARQVGPMPAGLVRGRMASVSPDPDRARRQKFYGMATIARSVQMQRDLVRELQSSPDWGAPLPLP